MSESYVQLAAEGIGPHVATQTVDEPQGVDTSGNAVAPTTVHRQVVAVVDSEGDVLSLSALGDISSKLTTTNELLEAILEALS